MKTQHVLVLGAGGNVSRFTVPKLVGNGHNVSALVRNPDHAKQLVDDGATVIVRDPVSYTHLTLPTICSV